MSNPSTATGLLDMFVKPGHGEHLRGQPPSPNPLQGKCSVEPMSQAPGRSSGASAASDLFATVSYICSGACAKEGLPDSPGLYPAWAAVGKKDG